MKEDLTLLSAVEAAALIRKGQLNSEQLVSQCLDRIEATDETIKAWVWIDREHALEQARETDRIRRAGLATGSLHGVPVGLKDIIDTADMPTQRGTDIFKDRMAHGDARLVERLREAGAVIIGKTKTTELAYLHPTDTTNPHDPSRSPAGSSSGSAAAVAARQVPLAVGTQTGGSVIRPASFCGAFGLKPTRGMISRSGVFRTSAALDQIGAFGNTLEDVALLADSLGCYDQNDPASFARPRPAMLAAAQAEAPIEPDFCWFDMPHHNRLDNDAREGLERVLDALGERVKRVPVAPQLAALTAVHRTIYDYEIARNVGLIQADYADQLSPEIIEAIERGRAIPEADYHEALEVKSLAEAFFASHFSKFDAIVAPSATGEAIPLSDGSTGDAVFCLPWTLAGLPCLSLPILTGENGLPIGVQLVGAAEKDDRLLRAARWMQSELAQHEV